MLCIRTENLNERSHNIWRLVQTGATFERSGAMSVADALETPKSIEFQYVF